MNAAKLSIAACEERKIVPMRKHADRIKQVAEYDALFGHRLEIEKRIGAQGRSGMPTAAHRHYALSTKLQKWAADGFPQIRLTVSDLDFPKTRMVKNGELAGTAAVRAALRKIIETEGIKLPAGTIPSIGAIGAVTEADRNKDASFQKLQFVNLGLTVPRKR